MDARRGIPIAHPFAHPVTMLTSDLSGRNDGHLRLKRETTVMVLPLTSSPAHQVRFGGLNDQFPHQSL